MAHEAILSIYTPPNLPLQLLVAIGQKQSIIHTMQIRIAVHLTTPFVLHTNHVWVDNKR